MKRTTPHRTQYDTRHKTQDTRHKTQDAIMDSDAVLLDALETQLDLLMLLEDDEGTLATVRAAVARVHEQRALLVRSQQRRLKPPAVDKQGPTS